MDRDGMRTYIQTAIWIGLGILLIIWAAAEKDPVRGTVGFSLTAAWASFVLTTKIHAESRTKRFAEVATMAVSFGIIVLGYILAGARILMVLTAVILALLTLAFVLSYAIPRIRKADP
ncbi:MAG: hypothetical protein H5T33_00205 [Candidatus Methanosuratus sp.]|nr:hypothetical protein [Candidatus Methanosuratincola sp.]